MKFFQYIALVGVACATRLTSHHATALHQAPISHHHLVKWENLTQDQEKEITDWIIEELTTGEKTITWDEMKKAITDFGKKHGFPALPAAAWKEI